MNHPFRQEVPLGQQEFHRHEHGLPHKKDGIGTQLVGIIEKGAHQDPFVKQGTGDKGRQDGQRLRAAQTEHGLVHGPLETGVNQQVPPPAPKVGRTRAGKHGIEHDCLRLYTRQDVGGKHESFAKGCQVLL